MGAFLVNFHCRSESPQSVAQVLVDQGFDRVWMAGPVNGWVSFWEEQASLQDTGRIQDIAEAVSRSLETPVIAFLVHDSDFMCYWLYDFGQVQDEFHSYPEFFEDSVSSEALTGDPYVLQRYCQPETSIPQLQAILVQGSQLEMLSGGEMSYVFAEERISGLAPLLGVNEDWARTDFNDIGSDVTPEELGAHWIGSDAPDDLGESFWEMDEDE
ncbi:MAG: hypothetical protein DWH91_15415 [Planctomycetota bacterium]|nr:MAG: hypothetical protein DWH91_15415 [Planctomycetota bacterium]